MSSSILILTQNAEVKQGKIENGSIKSIQKYFKKKESPEQICYYESGTNILFVFGYKKGKKRNKAETLRQRKKGLCGKGRGGN